MKIVTRNQLKFAGVLVLLSVAYQYGLNIIHIYHELRFVFAFQVFYFGSIFFFVWLFGRKEKVSISIVDLSFKYHIITYAICNSIAELWFHYNLQSNCENISYVHLGGLYWGFGLLVHFFLFNIFSKNMELGFE